MRMAVLCAAESWYFRDLVRAAADDYVLTPFSFTQLTANLEVRKRPEISVGTTDLRAFPAVLVRTMPPGSLEQVIFRMNALARLQSSGVLVVNPPRSIEIAVDKHLTCALLQEAGLRVPPTIVCQTFDEAMHGFCQLGGDVVVKPLYGGEGRGIMRVSDEAVAWRTFKTLIQLRAIIYQQPFLPHHGYDLRLFVLGDHIFAMRRRHPDDWRTNISRGAIAEPADLDDDLVEVARRATRLVGAMMAGVDILPAQDGQHYVLEVNAVPGWKALSQTLQLDIARLALQHISQLASKR